jgi:Helix-turn-helix domain
MATDRVHVASAEYIDEDGLSERYLIPPRTAQRWRATGGGPPFVRLGRRRVVYRVADVERWLAERTFAHRAEELVRQLATGTE